MQTSPELTAETSYLAAARRRLRRALGEEVVGIYAGGSWALGDYLPGRSDLDVAAVVRSGLSPQDEDGVVAGVRHESLPCPARRLELVVYRLDTARSGAAAPDFELNLNTGAGLPLSVESRRAPGKVAGHWFAIDRSVLAQAGVALSGAPVADVFAPVPRLELIPVVAESIRWHRGHEAASPDAVLNACRGLRFATDGRWSSKAAAGRWAVAAGLAPGDLVAAACRARVEPVALDPADVTAFLQSVESRLSAASS